MPSRHDKKETGLDRRQFLKKTAITCGLAAGAGAWGYLFYSDEPVRKKQEKNALQTNNVLKTQSLQKT